MARGGHEVRAAQQCKLSELRQLTGQHRRRQALAWNWPFCGGTCASWLTLGERGQDCGSLQARDFKRSGSGHAQEPAAFHPEGGDAWECRMFR